MSSTPTKTGEELPEQGTIAMPLQENDARASAEENCNAIAVSSPRAHTNNDIYGKCECQSSIRGAVRLYVIIVHFLLKTVSLESLVKRVKT